jgi:hypothetical protein
MLLLFSLSSLLYRYPSSFLTVDLEQEERNRIDREEGEEEDGEEVEGEDEGEGEEVYTEGEEVSKREEEGEDVGVRVSEEGAVVSPYMLGLYDGSGREVAEQSSSL